MDENIELRKCVVCYLVQDDRVLLGLRKKSSRGLGISRVAGIGGGIEDNESADEALCREVYEEVGVELTDFKKMGRVVFLYPNTTKWNGEPSESDEIYPDFFSINDLPFDRMFVDNPYWVPHVLAGKTVEARFIYDENHQIQESRIEFFD